MIEINENVTENTAADTALVRVEELSPFPFSLLADQLRRYANARAVVWVQEEPHNMVCFGERSDRDPDTCRGDGVRPNSLTDSLNSPTPRGHHSLYSYTGRADVCGAPYRVCAAAAAV